MNHSSYPSANNEENTHVPKSIRGLGLNHKQMRTGSCPEDQLWIIQELIRIKEPEELEKALLQEASEVLDSGHLKIAAFIVSKDWFLHSLTWMHEEGIYVPQWKKDECKEKYPSWAHLRDNFINPRNPAFYFMGAPVYVTIELQSRTIRTTPVMAIPIIPSSPTTANQSSNTKAKQDE